MKLYITENKKEYTAALLDIIHNEKQGIIQYTDEDENKYVRTYVLSVFDTNLDRSILYGSYEYELAKALLDKPHKLANTTLKYSGTFANNTLYDPAGFVKYATDETLPVRHMKDAAKELAEKVKNKIRDMLMEEYPDIPSIPERYREGLKGKDILSAVRKTVLEGKYITPFNPYVDSAPYENLDTVIEYDKTNKNDKEENVKEKALQYLQMKDSFKETKKDILLPALAWHYTLEKAVKENNGFLDEEFSIFREIKKKIEEFTDKNPETKKLKVAFAGKQAMMDTWFAKKHADINIEGKPVLMTVTPRILTFLPEDGHGKLKDEYNLMYSETNIESPKYKEEYSNRNYQYIEHLRPTDIEKITYGKTVIYNKK